MRNGTVVAAGPPGEIVTTELIRGVFDVDAMIIPDPVTAMPLVIPLPRSAAEDTGAPLSGP